MRVEENVENSANMVTLGSRIWRPIIGDALISAAQGLGGWILMVCCGLFDFPFICRVVGLRVRPDSLT